VKVQQATFSFVISVCLSLSVYLSVSYPVYLFCLSVLNNLDPTGQTLSSHTRETLFFVKCMLGQTRGMCGRFHVACYDTDET